MTRDRIAPQTALHRARARACVFALSLVIATACTHSPALEQEHRSSPASEPDVVADAGATAPNQDAERSPSSHAGSASVPPFDASSPSPADAAADLAPTPSPSAADSGPPANHDDHDDHDDDDAGSAPTNPDPPCASRSCLCSAICTRGTALNCVDEATLADCITLCEQPPPPACADEAALALACNASQPASSYSCDPDLWVFIVAGCATEEVALQACRIR